MTQTTQPSTPGVPATTPQSSVWPPPTGTVIPFPLPWGQTGCCPPGGMSALMQCYCDIQQASAFIGQILIDQINNNPAVTAAIIAAIEKSGSSLPLIGVTNGQAAQPGQVGEFINISSPNIPYGTAASSTSWTAGVLPPGDWDVWAYLQSYGGAPGDVEAYLNPVPSGFTLALRMVEYTAAPASAQVWLVAPQAQALISQPSLVNFQINFNTWTTGPAAGEIGIGFLARRRR